MMRCQRPHCGGQVVVDDDRACCLLCGQVVREPEPSTLEKMLSNATPEQDEHGFTFGDRVPANIDEIKARVMARIRQEAARG